MTQKRRVESALAWAQKRLGTSYHFIVTAAAPEDVDGHTLMAIARTGRGDSDPNAFHVVFNAKAVKQTPMSDLRKIAVHENVHAILWPCTQRAPRDKEEAAVYIIQRALVGEIKG